MYRRFSFPITAVIVFLFLLTELLFAQAGTYYNSINTSASTFVTDLGNRIRNPYTKISYDNFDETNIANFASINNGNGTRSVFCVYSNYEHIYTGVFSWIPMSREHTYCHSWQPGHPSESLPEYSDQYHLFPTHQNGANGVRSNHPLGNVVSVISTFLEGTYGTDINGNFVYEPRDEHKGDAARAILYMPVRYNGINGYDWTFNWLNNTRLPSIGEAPQDLATLIQWHKQDPPDKWEVDRNNYIQSIQQNRNPFVDHPEYINYINFNNLSKLSPVYSVEPTNYVTNFTAASQPTGISFSWTDAAAGTQLPSDYLLIVYNRNNYFLPIDGETYTTDTDLSDGKAVINISYSAANNFELTGLADTTTYYGVMISYNGLGATINYKIDETFPTAFVTYNGTLATEPSNHVTNFSQGTVTSSSIQLTWTDALPGTQVPEAYLLLANQTGIFTDPVDGTSYSDDTNLSDGSARVNVLYTSSDSYTFSGLSSNTVYHFRIYSYNGVSGQKNYKTDGTVPTINVQTSSGGSGNISELFISEYVEGSSNNKAIEIYNGTSSAIDLSASGHKLEFYFNGSTSVGTTINLTGTLNAGDVFVVASASANSAILNVADQTSSSAFYNGDDAVVLKKGSVIVDVIGQVGFDPGSEWGTGLTSTADNTLRRFSSTTQGDTNPNDVFDPSIEWTGYPTDTFDDLGTFTGSLVQTFQLSVLIEDGWNMVSVPGLNLENQNVTTWWSGKDPAAGVYKFVGGYQEITSTIPGEGYWMKHLGTKLYNTGDEWSPEGIQFVTHTAIPGNAGWNIIGGFESTVLTSGITTTPGGLQIGQIFGYSSGYTPANNMVPGYGYWINLSEAGLINIPDVLKSSSSNKTISAKEYWGKIVISDISGKNYTLFAVNEKINLDEYELPPAPPAGMFDVRFGSSRYAEDLSTDNQTIELSGMEYPVRVSVKNVNIKLQDETGKIINETLTDGEELIISSNSVSILLVSENKIPGDYSLKQNFPNPFNPVTKIRFSIPKEANVNLSVYNVLGEKITELVNEVLLPDNYEVEFDASALASGIYIYRVSAGNFALTRKMMLIK